MALLDDILAWSEGLPSWQRDALRRLFVNRTMSPDDLGEILAMVKEEHGAARPAAVQPLVFCEDDIPAVGARANVHLLRIDNLQHVNRLPAGHAVDIAPDKLTVLFGENGAGKSGYARILKNACRARTKAPVLPDAFTVGLPRPTPSADITFVINGGETHTASWRQGAVVARALGNVAVYDSACGADYVAKEGVSDYQPYGLPYLNRLADAQKSMQGTIDQERQQIRLNAAAFLDLHGQHEVGEILGRLSKDTDLARLRALATLTAEDIARVSELEKILGTMNPEPDARAAERLADRLDTAAASAQKSHRYVTDKAVDEVRLRQANANATADAWKLAQERLQKSEDNADVELLDGTGNDVWKMLFKAAEAFSIGHAYPEHSHPNVDDGARCVLCQSPLDESAKSRLSRFATFVADAASTDAEAAATRMRETMAAIAEANLTPLDAPTLTELEAADPALHTFVVETLEAWVDRRRWVATCVDTRDWSPKRAPLPDGDALDVRLRIKAVALRTHAKELRASLDPEVKRALDSEKLALVARQSLVPRLNQIEQHVRDANLHYYLTNAYNALAPRKVSLKMTELAGTYVTAELAKVMTQELTALGYRKKVLPDIKGRTDVGQTMVTLKVKDCNDAPGQVLSEGEQRAMALALFLAEVRLQDHQSTVVFDDPSTSFDHHHRQHIADRIVALAAERPVVIFTHDAVFLTELSHAIGDRNQPVAYRTIAWASTGPGFVSEGLTWETMNTDARLDDLEASVKPLTAYAGDYMDEKTKEGVKVGYTKLRGTIERAVREVFLNNTVRPFTDEVSVGSFGAVIGHPKDEWDRMSGMYNRCCEVTDAHDTNAARQRPIPNPSELLEDIAVFKENLGKAKVRRKAFQKERGSQGEAAKNLFG
ncbi:energy-coupling factor transporter ATP-binding protein EcfA2 [Luteibacter sp. HA06]